MIRMGTADDAEILTELGRLMHHESQYGAFSFNEDKVYAMIYTAATHDDGCLIVAEDKDGRVVGAIMGWVSDFWFGNDRMMCDLALFIEPEARGGMTGARLIKRFIQYGEAIGCKQVMLSNSTTVDKDRVAKLYERMGMDHLGYVYAHNCERE